MSGFEFCETMVGAFHLRGDLRDRPFSFTARARSESWSRFVRRPEVALEGEVDAEGFADHRPLRGTLGMDPLRTRTLPYDLRFRGNDGATYSFVGQKTLRLAHLVQSMTVLPGDLRSESGEVIGNVLLRFDLRGDLVRFLRSFDFASL